MANRLAGETSPYLLQHRDNPVDWYPWGEEALARAREQDRPVLLSVGYSACHWCHVMERESFEDEATAAYMNEHFVPIKVDREERPDVDAIYMEAVQSMTGHGGWPMTVFLDPDGVPFYGGTYFPPDESRGMPSFRMVMEAVLVAWRDQREEIRERAGLVRERLGALGALEPSAGRPDPAALEAAVAKLLERADRRYGGFGGAPKFPPASALELLLARGETAVVSETLDAMLAGGICDQLGGGFARYAVDRVWLVPHFEKMLYDNALLASAYLHGFQALGHERWRRVCEETLDWMLREMRGSEGGFYSALDADSEGVEGRFYVWTPEEIRAALGESGAAGNGTPSGNGAVSNDDLGGGGSAASPLAGSGPARPDDAAASAAEVIAFYGVSERGNFEGANVLHRAGGATAPEPPGLDAARARLLAARAARVRPGLDDKRLASWNALAISALAETGAVLGRADYLSAARECAEFVLGTMRDEHGHLLRTYKDGRAHLNAYLEDHAFLLEALLTLYEASFEPRWFEAARDLADEMIDRFGDRERGGFFSTSTDHEELIVRRKEVGDHPIPSGNSAAALGLLRLAALSGERRYAAAAEGVVALFSGPALEHPDSFAHMLRAIDFELARVREVALVGDDFAPLAAVIRAEHRPHLVLAAGPEGSEQPPLLAGRAKLDGRTAAYVCENFACRLPVAEPDRLRELL